jgi:hypothetical protein
MLLIPAKRVHSPATANTRARWERWLWPALCCAVLLGAILAAHPFNEAGFEDDWSYGRVALKLAQTGRIQYNGWGGALILTQTLWAAPWIRLFGFSFPVLQWSSVPFSLGFVLLVYAAGRLAGLSRELSAFAAMCTATSPLFLPLAASFMTEPCACFCTMACICAALRALQAPASRETVRWLWILTLAGLAGGADRQLVWLAPLAFIPYIAWRRRGERAVAAHALAAFGVLVVAIVVLLRLFAQPYGPARLGRDQLVWLLLNRSGEASRQVLRFLFLCLLLSVPAFACLLPHLRWRPVARTVLCLFGLAALTTAGILFGLPVPPYGNNIVTRMGICVGRLEQVVLGPSLAVILSVVVDACMVVSVLWIVRTLREGLPHPQRDSLSLPGIFFLSYLPFVFFPGALIGQAFDRYMLPLLPVFLLAILTQAPHAGGRVPKAAWICLLLFAGYGVASTHDYFEGLRARVRAAHDLERRGIDPVRFSAGFEYDSWAQLERTEYVKGPGYEDYFADRSAKGFWPEIWNHLADIRPEFVVMNWIRPGPPRADPARVFAYRAWLPPFQRYVVVWDREDLSAELRVARACSTIRLRP